MKKNVKLLVIMAIVLVGLAGVTTLIKPASNELAQGLETMVITHEQGETEVKKNPENVLVFDYGVVDALDYMGVEVDGVVQSGLPNYLTKYASEEYVNLGGLKEPDFEAIYAAKPDLIIISGRQRDFYEQLSEIAPTVMMTLDD
ncbi:MAG: ABC transporter substrate-binding protein, partial [Turicibacter sp.]